MKMNEDQRTLPTNGNPTSEQAIAATTPPGPKQDSYFRVLGYDRSVYFFLHHISDWVVAIDLNKNPSLEGLELKLLSLAPLEFWEAKYPSRPGATTWELAADSLFRQCEMAGVYDSEETQ